MVLGAKNKINSVLFWTLSGIHNKRESLDPTWELVQKSSVKLGLCVDSCWIQFSVNIQKMVALFPKERGVFLSLQPVIVMWTQQWTGWEWCWDKERKKTFWCPINMVSPFFFFLVFVFGLGFFSKAKVVEMPILKSLSQRNAFQLNKINWTISFCLERQKEENKVLRFSLSKFKWNKMSSYYPISPNMRYWRNEPSPAAPRALSIMKPRENKC